MDQEVLTLPEVAKIFRVDEVTVQRWVKIGVLPAIWLPRYGKRQEYRVLRATIDSLLAQKFKGK